jgi:hypothetical protein
MWTRFCRFRGRLSRGQKLVWIHSEQEKVLLYISSGATKSPK